MSFSKILIANRGEIACRILRTARQLGYSTVAVFSEADRHAPHVALADEAVFIGPAPALESYLQVPALLEAARRTGADAVHPGYGFLSENAGFAQAVLDAGMVFIGPPPDAIQAMGDKALAKRRMLQAGVPCAPGYLGADQDDRTLLAEAQKLGFPLLVKAVAGGGGRGMRLVHAPDQMQAAQEGARREAQSAFGDATLMLERLIENGRHIEIQVFADAHGNAVYLGERDCTAQRRRQKVIEEAPSPVVSSAMREAMGRDAVAAALAVGYRGAGTVEFIVDAQLQHYFLEMNTRLQVEHPVTEMITGLDLVEWQLRVASGEVLPLRQEEVRYQGHAIEARLYAEDPYTGFTPQTGRVLWWQPDEARCLGARIDDGIRQGDEVSPFYDPMVAKFIVHGRDREDAIRRMRAALCRAPLLGLRNNGRFLFDLVDHPAFRQAQMSTALIDQWLESGESLLQAPGAHDDAWLLAAAALAAEQSKLGPGRHWRPESVASYGLTLQCAGESRALRVRPQESGVVLVQTVGQGSAGAAAASAGVAVQVMSWDQGRLRFALSGVQRQAIAIPHSGQLHLALDGQIYVFEEASAFPQEDAALDARRARAPVAGKVTQIAVAPGQAVQSGQPLVCVEAMKMEMWLSAQANGVVSALHVRAGDQVESGAVLVEIDIQDPKEA